MTPENVNYSSGFKSQTILITCIELLKIAQKVVSFSSEYKQCENLYGRMNACHSITPEK